ncbi:uncharacterized protein si:ch211-127m7.2 isoform X1 [Pseudoliparis swirei]|uniref:uncharacterized protein si:ch211-127m7.2 isoform X1 n=1 Tax=Pseudoliparis swirei TaxID=2059687 RepID=UPI0024BE69AE|nr:uncharacterized protein si:ch211-127m7.2 isoform X1 [Pseudoliparis swirei]
MSERHRALPSWMAKKEEKVKEKEPLKRRSKRKAARAAFYCMNEKELVDAAVSYHTNEDVALPTGLQVALFLCFIHLQVEDQAAASTVNLRGNSATSKERAKLLTLEEEPSDCEDALEMTYVSETDTDITEVQTVPYTHSPLHQGPEGQRSGPEQDRGGLVSIGLEAEEKEEHSQLPAEEDDSLRLVRDFFFT